MVKKAYDDKRGGTSVVAYPLIGSFVMEQVVTGKIKYCAVKMMVVIQK